jgi:uncharacterized membrane protein
MSQELVLDNRLESAKTTAWWLYLLHGVSLVFSLGTFSVLLFVVNYLQRPNTTGTFVYSHHTWMIKSFCWYVGLMLLGALFFVTIIGILIAYPIWFCTWLWMAYRLIVGIQRLGRNEAADA